MIFKISVKIKINNCKIQVKKMIWKINFFLTVYFNQEPVIHSIQVLKRNLTRLENSIFPIVNFVKIRKVLQAKKIWDNKKSPNLWAILRKKKKWKCYLLTRRWVIFQNKLRIKFLRNKVRKLKLVRIHKL